METTRIIFNFLNDTIGIAGTTFIMAIVAGAAITLPIFFFIKFLNKYFLDNYFWDPLGKVVEKLFNLVGNFLGGILKIALFIVPPILCVSYLGFVLGLIFYVLAVGPVQLWLIHEFTDTRG